MKKIFFYIVIPFSILVVSIVIIVKLFTTTKPSPVEVSHSVSTTTATTQFPQGTPTTDSAATPKEEEIITDTSINVALSCMTWYAKGYMRGVIYDSARKMPQAKTCFTTKYTSQWEQISNRYGSDPVLFVQDYDESWKTAPPKAFSTEETGQTAKILVEIGAAEAKLRLDVHLVFYSGVWMIDSVIPLPSSN
jgi:hypothetical protein